MSLRVIISPDRMELGRRAAADIAAAVRKQFDPFTILFAAAPSQNETLDTLAQTAALPWYLARACHLDEYIGLTQDAPQSFRRYLLDRIVGPAGIEKFEGLRGEAEDIPAELARYSHILETQYPSIGCIGIGENGHIAFNDPPHSKFSDHSLVRHVELTYECRDQQVHDLTFPNLDAVPTHALTLSIHALMRVPELFVMVPGKRKAEAIRRTLGGEVTEECPSTILTTHPNATLYIDDDSASLL